MSPWLTIPYTSVKPLMCVSSTHEIEILAFASNSLGPCPYSADKRNMRKALTIELHLLEWDVQSILRSDFLEKYFDLTLDYVFPRL